VQGKGKEDRMRALLCGCGKHLEARDDKGLAGRFREHLRREHPSIILHDDHIETIVSERAYDYERVLVYAEGERREDEFGPEPY
jgi:predicted small metal-binding protein